MVIQTISGKAVAGCQCLTTSWYFFRPESKNGCLENYICVLGFKHRSVTFDQVFCTHCLLQSWRFQQRAQNTNSITFLVCSFKHAHVCI